MVYFLRDETTRRIKIGYTAGNGESRLKDLQTGSSGVLTLLAEMPGEKCDEKALHTRFAEHRVQGEWFAPVPEILLLIEETKNARLEAQNAELRELLSVARARITSAWAALGALAAYLSGEPMGLIKGLTRPEDPKEAEIERPQAKLEAERTTRRNCRATMRNIRQSLEGELPAEPEE